tara:strand:- start:2367 stop:2882 length:516 start_codon:yes stop_codon:yes gene_type:complete
MQSHQAKHIVCNIIPNTFFNVEKWVWAYMNDVDYSRFNDISENPTAQQERAAIEQGRHFIEEAKTMCHPLDHAKVGDGLSFGEHGAIDAYTIVDKDDNTITAKKDIATVQSNGTYTHAPNPDALPENFMRVTASDNNSSPEVRWVISVDNNAALLSAEAGRKTVVNYPVAV